MDLNFLPHTTLHSVVCLPMTSRQSQPQWRSSSCQRAPDRIPKQIATVTVYSRHAVGSIYLGHIGPALHFVQSICIVAPTDCAMEMLCTCTVNLIRPNSYPFPVWELLMLPEHLRRASEQWRDIHRGYPGKGGHSHLPGEPPSCIAQWGRKKLRCQKRRHKKKL